jgi:tetratricopeptide (TPR) repeat protein
MTRTGRILMASPAALLVATFVGCGGIQQGIEENARQLKQQQAQLDQLKQEVAALQAQPTAGTPQAGGAPPSLSARVPAGPHPTSESITGFARGARSAAGCDQAVTREATRKGGKKFAAGEFAAALGYYQDAVAACPTSAQAELNVARAYEALGKRDEAIAHYQSATRLAANDGDNTAGKSAREALSRLGAN